METRVKPNTNEEEIKQGDSGAGLSPGPKPRPLLKYKAPQTRSVTATFCSHQQMEKSRRQNAVSVGLESNLSCPGTKS